MTVEEILKGSDKLILENIDLLARIYLEKKGKKLNRSCPSCVSEMVLTLKNIYNMTKFKFKRNAASYKNKKGDKKTISNSTMTDAKAIAFLKTDPKRIDLFSDYPSNWKKLIKGEVETPEEEVSRIAAEAEALEVEKAKKIESAEKKEEIPAEKKPEVKEEEKPEVSEVPAEKKEDLLKLSLKKLRVKYPKIKATSINDFVEKILAE